MIDQELNIARHSAAHIMAAAVQKLWPDAKFDIGPATEDGFYYDFDMEHRLTADDLRDSKVPEDSILLAANSVDVHGRFGPASNEYTPISGDYYGVPYRSLIAKGVSNLLLAGRNVSADSTAAGAIRVMPPCMGMGQASGTAAALAVKQGITPRQVDAQELRSVLKANGAYL